MFNLVLGFAFMVVVIIVAIELIFYGQREGAIKGSLAYTTIIGLLNYKLILSYSIIQSALLLFIVFIIYFLAFKLANTFNVYNKFLYFILFIVSLVVVCIAMYFIAELLAAVLV